MKLQTFILTHFIIAGCYAQTIDTKKTCAELIAKVYELGEINKDMFKNVRHSGSCVYVIVNEVIEQDSLKLKSSVYEYDVAKIKVLYYPRKSIAGYRINYWFQLDGVTISGNDAAIHFKTICSTDNWLEEYDQVHLDGKVEFQLSQNGQWNVKRKKIREYKITRQCSQG